jgi:hypothetical protein
MFSALTKLRLDERNISLFENAPKKLHFNTSSGSLIHSEIEELRKRTYTLQLQHEENSRKAKLNEEIVTSRETSAQLLQLSLRMLLDVVDRQAEVTHLDLAKQLFGIKKKEFQQQQESTISRALDAKNGGNVWKETILTQLKNAIDGLAVKLNDQNNYDEQLLAARGIMSIIRQLDHESMEAKILVQNDYSRKEINYRQDQWMKLTNSPYRSLLGLTNRSRIEEDQHGNAEDSSQLATTPPKAMEETTFMTNISSPFPKRSPPNVLDPVSSPNSPKLFSSSSSPHHQKMLSSSSTPMIFSSSSSPHHQKMLSSSSTPMIETTKIRCRQAKFSNKLIRYGEHKSRWSQILINELKPFVQKSLVHIHSFQKKWLMLISLAARTSKWGNIHLIQRREEIAEEKAKVQAVIRMQSMFRGGFTRDLHEKFVKVKEMLLERLWIIRL